MESKDKRKCKYPQLNDANCKYIIDIDIVLTRLIHISFI